MRARMRVTTGIGLVALVVFALAPAACDSPSSTAYPGASSTPTGTQTPLPVSSPTPAMVDSPSPTETPSSAPDLSSGILGEVTIGPTCPVLREDSSCPDRPFKAEIIVENADTKEAIITIRTDSEGRFRIPLAPGDYYLHPVDPNPGVPPFGKGLSVAVVPGEFTNVSVQYDSGIRSGQ